MSKTIDEILAPKPEARPRIYAYAIADKAHAGLLKIGQTTRNVKQRVAEQLKTAAIQNYTIVLDESAERDDGTIFSDHAVRKDIGGGFDTKTITLSCGKLTTGVTVPQWSSILMLRNLKSPETYFQAAFRVQSPWSIKNPNGDNPHEEEILKPVCFVFDFAPTRALRQLSEYAIGLSPNEPNPESAVRELVSFLPVLAYDGANMTQIDAGGILDIAIAGTSATLLARKWESALLVNVDNDTLRRILDNPEAMAAVERIEGWRALGDNIIETIINKSEAVKALKNKAKDEELSPKEKRSSATRSGSLNPSGSWCRKNSSSSPRVFRRLCI
jgi:L-rhamnose mutarotase